MSEPVRIDMPLSLTPAMIAAVRNDPLCACPPEEWHVKLGWLICAYDALIESRQKKYAERATPGGAKP